MNRKTFFNVVGGVLFALAASMTFPPDAPDPQDSFEQRLNSGR